MKKMIIVSDLHFHAHKSHASTTDGGMNSRLEQAIGVFEHIAKTGRRMGVKTMAVCGDIFHVRGTLKPSVFNRVHGAVSAIAEMGIKIVMIPGNHDMEDVCGKHTAIDTFASIEGCTVLGGNYAEEVTANGWRIIGIPYVHKIEDFKGVFIDAVADLRPDEKTVMLIHQGIDEFEPNVPATGLTAEWLEDTVPCMVFAGHYHRPGKKGRVVSVGAPMQHTFGGEGQERGFWIYDEVGAVEFFPVTADKAPRFKTVASKKDLLDGSAKGCFVRIKAKTVKAAKTMRQAALDGGALDVRIELEKEYTTAHEKTVGINIDSCSMLREYMKIFPEKYDANAVVEITDLYKKLCLS